MVTGREAPLPPYTTTVALPAKAVLLVPETITRVKTHQIV